jgi:hypothetical protein
MATHDMARTWVELHVLSKDEPGAARQRHAAESVFRYFEDTYGILPDPKVVCILDGQDGWDLKRELGAENRGVNCLPRGRIYRSLPNYVRPLIGPVNPRTNEVTWPFEMVIYLHGTTCETEIGLSLCFAHELQHFIQYAQRRPLWALNVLLVELHNPDFHFWWDFPTEREARIVSKRLGLELFGKKAIDLYIKNQISAQVTDTDTRDWEFFSSIDLSTPYDLAIETMQLVESHRVELVRALEKFRGEAAFAGLGLERLIRGADVH